MLQKSDLVGPSDWLDTLEIGGPYVLPAHLDRNTVRATTAKPRFADRKFRFEKAGDKVHIFRVELDMELEKRKAAARRRRRKSQHLPTVAVSKRRDIEGEIDRLRIGDRLSLAKNEYGVRGRAAIVSRNTGRQFTVEEKSGAKFLVRRG